MFLTEDLDCDKELDDIVRTYNTYMDGTMSYTSQDGWYKLFINKVLITEGDVYDITTRVKQINRENGLDHLGV